MKHHFVVLLTLSFFALSSFGCKGAEPEPEPDPQPETYEETAEPVSQVIGVDGGTIEVESSGGATLSIEIPADALWRETEITLTPSDPVEDEWIRVDVAPAGLQLREAATVTIEAPTSVTLSGDTFVAFSGGDQSTPIATSRSGSILTAETTILGLPVEEEPADGLRRQALANGGAILAANYPCDIRLQLAVDKAKELAQQPGLYSLALQLFQLQQTILSDDGCEAVQEKLADQVGPIACDGYEAAVASAEGSEPSSSGDFGRTIKPVLYWAAEAAALGESCAADFQGVLESEADKFLTYYAERLASIDEDGVDGLRFEAQELVFLWGELLTLGLSDGADRLVSDLFQPTMSRLRAGLYRLVRDTESTFMLAGATDAGFAQPRMIIGSTPPPYGPALGFPLGYADADVHADIQYALSTATVSSSLGEATVQGGEEPGTQVTTGAIEFLETDTVKLSGVVRGMTCWKGDALDAKDQLIVKLDGVEVQTLTKDTATGDFLTSDVEIDIANFFSANNISFNDGEVYELTIERTRPLDGEQAVYCPERVMGPTTYELFRIEMTAQDVSYVGTYTGECRIVEPASCVGEENVGSLKSCWMTLEELDADTYRLHAAVKRFPGAIDVCSNAIGWQYEVFEFPKSEVTALSGPSPRLAQGYLCSSGPVETRVEPEPDYRNAVRGGITPAGVVNLQFAESAEDFCEYWEMVMVERCSDEVLDSSGDTPPCMP